MCGHTLDGAALTPCQTDSCAIPAAAAPSRPDPGPRLQRPAPPLPPDDAPHTPASTIFRLKPGLLHPELDCLHRIRRLYGGRLGFIRLDERGHHVQVLTFRAIRRGVSLHKLGDLLQCSLVIRRGTNGGDVHLSQPDGCGIYLLVLGVRADELHVHNAYLVSDRHDQPLVVALDVEHHAVIGNEACIPVDVLNVLRDFHVAAFASSCHAFKGCSACGSAPIVPERGNGDDPHVAITVPFWDLSRRPTTAQGGLRRHLSQYAAGRLVRSRSDLSRSTTSRSTC